MKLNLGCGDSVNDGYTNVDIIQTHPSVKVMDLSVFPWDFNDNSVEEIQAHAIVEHIPQHLKMTLIKEMWRVCKNGSLICISTCSFDHPNMWQDPSHVSCWHIDNFNYFVDGYYWNYYSEVRFKIQKKELRKEKEGNQLYWELEVEK